MSHRVASHCVQLLHGVCTVGPICFSRNPYVCELLSPSQNASATKHEKRVVSGWDQFAQLRKPTGHTSRSYELVLAIAPSIARSVCVCVLINPTFVRPSTMTTWSKKLQLPCSMKPPNHWTDLRTALNREKAQCALMMCSQVSSNSATLQLCCGRWCRQIPTSYRRLLYKLMLFHQSANWTRPSWSTYRLAKIIIPIFNLQKCEYLLHNYIFEFKLMFE